jgi:hypothetical protein
VEKKWKIAEGEEEMAGCILGRGDAEARKNSDGSDGWLVIGVNTFNLTANG